MLETAVDYINFADFDRAGRVRVTGLPFVGIKMNPVILNVRMNGIPTYDVGPIVRCIYRRAQYHGVDNKYALYMFSKRIPECRLDPGDIVGSLNVDKATAIKIIKLACILNEGCVTGLEHY